VIPRSGAIAYGDCVQTESLAFNRPSIAPASAQGLRVALFSGNYNYIRDGANKALNKLVGHLLDEGAAVRVYSPTTPTPAFDPVGDLVSVPSIAVPGRPEFRAALGLPAAIRRDIDSFAPNLVHVSAPDGLSMAALRYARRLGIPTVASFHTRFETYFEYYGLGWLRRWAWGRQRRLYLGVDLVLAPNPAIRAHLQDMGVPADRIRIWGRGVETDVFTPNLRDEGWRLRQGYAKSDAVLLFFGRVVLEKGIDCFVDTVRELRAAGRKLRPLVIGDGPARVEMERGLGDALFIGHLDGPELGRAIASADILLNPSMTEAFGNVNLEAMAAGLAVVSADAGSARALITDGENGLLRPTDPKIMAQAIGELIDEPATRARMGHAAAATAARLQWPEVLDAVIDAYRELKPEE
jgi:glycosyltransferase involved in cell wall biosynthesis